MITGIHQTLLFFFLVTVVSFLPRSLPAAGNAGNETDIVIPEIPLDTGDDIGITAEDNVESSKAPEIKTGPSWQKPNEQSALRILNELVQPGELKVLTWTSGQSFSGRTIKPPVLVVRGRRAGPVLCLVAAIHGDEINGIEIVRRVVRDLDPMKVNGTVIGVPIVNIFGFTGNTRYLPDRRDLNRYFPGNTTGSAASRIAHRFFTQIISHCNYVVDFHTGSFKRNNLPQLRADMNNEKVRDFVQHFGSIAVLHKSGHGKSLRAAASRAGIPTVTFELGQPGWLQDEFVEAGIKTIEHLIGHLGIVNRLRLWFEPQPVYYSSRWVRVNSGGILLSDVKIGADVKEGGLLGTVINPLTNKETKIVSPVNGRVLGMALNQFMLPGYAAFHIGVSTDTRSMTREELSETNDFSEEEFDDEPEDNGIDPDKEPDFEEELH